MHSWRLRAHLLSSSLYALVLIILFFISAQEWVRRAEGQQLSVSRQNNGTAISDFVIFYTAGKIARSSERYQCFDVAVQQNEFRRVLGATSMPEKMIYVRCMPVIFPLLMPFTLVSLSTAHVIWCCISLAVAVLGGFLMLRQIGGLGWNDCWLWLLGLGASFPVFMTLLTGQFSLLMLGLFEIYFWAWYRKRDFIAGTVLALTVFRPQYAVFWGLPALIGKRWKLLATCLCAELAVVSITAATIGFGNILYYPRFLTQLETAASPNAQAMPCLRGLLNLFFPDASALRICVVIFTLTIILLGFIWLKVLKQNASASAPKWLMLIGTILALLVSPHSHLYDCTLIAAGALMLPGMSVWKSIFAKPISYKLWCVILIFYPLLSWTFFVCPCSSVAFRVVAFVAINAILAILGFFILCKELASVDTVAQSIERD